MTKQPSTSENPAKDERTAIRGAAKEGALIGAFLGMFGGCITLATPWGLANDDSLGARLLAACIVVVAFFITVFASAAFWAMLFVGAELLGRKLRSRNQ